MWSTCSILFPNIYHPYSPDAVDVSHLTGRHCESDWPFLMWACFWKILFLINSSHTHSFRSHLSLLFKSFKTLAQQSSLLWKFCESLSKEELFGSLFSPQCLVHILLQNLMISVVRHGWCVSVQQWDWAPCRQGLGWIIFYLTSCTVATQRVFVKFCMYPTN